MYIYIPATPSQRTTRHARRHRQRCNMGETGQHSIYYLTVTVAFSSYLESIDVDKTAMWTRYPATI